MSTLSKPGGPDAEVVEVTHDEYANAGLICAPAHRPADLLFLVRAHPP